MRDYRLSKLPVLLAETSRDDQDPQPLPDRLVSLPEGQREALLRLYEQTVSAWKQLVDVRFKLVGFVPAVSAGLLIALLGRPEKEGQGLSAQSQAAIAALGALVTAALWVYERRNSELHDDLVSRARRIEFELGLGTGVFRGRLRHRGLVKHDYAIGAIYLVALAGWVFAVLAAIFDW